MTDTLWGALIVSIVGPSVLFGLSRVFGGWRKDETENEASVASQWQAWAHEQGERIEKLEHRVSDLEAALVVERETNARLSAQNQRQGAMLTSLVRWAILLRDEVIRLGGDVPAAPIEVESAMTNLDA